MTPADGSRGTPDVEIPGDYLAVLQDVLGGRIGHVMPLSLVNNAVYKIACRSHTYVAKFYSTKGMHRDNEILVLTSIPAAGKRLVKNLVYADESCTRLPVRFAVFEYLEGRTVLELVSGGSEVPERWFVDRVIAFLEAAFAVPTTRFGTLQGTLHGSHERWWEFLHSYQALTSYTLMACESTRHLAALPYQIVARLFDLPAPDQSILCPLDLNLANFLVTTDGRLVVLDPGTVIAGIRMASYGEFIAQVYGTRFFDPFVEAVGLRGPELAVARAHAALSSLNVLGFVVRNRTCPPQEATPWGNPLPYLQIIRRHAEELGIWPPPVEARESERMLHVRQAE